jgi:hypothetical protein
MADEEYRLLQRQFLTTGDPILGHHLMQAGLRKSITLLQCREDGIPWEIVSRYLHRWSQAILAPDEVQFYKQMLGEETDWHPDFISRNEFFVTVSADESWSPNFPGNFLSMMIGFSTFGHYPTVGMSARKIRKKLHNQKGPYWHHLNRLSWGAPGTDLALRISFWGADDTGMELDMGPEGSGFGRQPVPYPNNLILLDDILRNLPNPVTRLWLGHHGFTGA